MTNTYPATYARGDQRRAVHTAADAVKARFDGFVAVELDDDVEYADLQAQAKELGIKANQSAEKLTEAINAKLADADVPEGDDVDEHAGDQSVDTVGTVNQPANTSDVSDFDGRF